MNNQLKTLCLLTAKLPWLYGNKFCYSVLLRGSNPFKRSRMNFATHRRFTLLAITLFLVRLIDIAYPLMPVSVNIKYPVLTGIELSNIEHLTRYSV